MMRTVILMMLMTLSLAAFAGDLDDGIKIDDGINDDIKLDTNIKYIVRRAKASAENAKQGVATTTGKIIVNDGCGGVGNQVFGAGANLKGATIVNLSNNKGATSACAK